MRWLITLPLSTLEGFQAKWSPVWRRIHAKRANYSIDVIERGKQCSPRGPGGDRRDQHGLHGERQIARGTQRKRPQQCRKLVSDRRAGEPARDRFGEAEAEHRRAAADQSALEAQPEEMPEKPVGDVAVA